jgi:ribonuclease R
MDPEETMRAIAEEAGLSLTYPEAVQREVRAIEADPGVEDPGLADLCGLPFVTIDYPDSRDLDQAIQIERRDGGYMVRYALADASYYVRPGSALFSEALRRGVSYYLPGLTVPMLPRALSEGVISLLPDRDRRAVVFEMALDDRGQALSTALVRARICSRAKLSYTGVQAHFDGAGPSLSGQAFSETLELLREVGELRLADARRRDVIAFHREEAVVVFRGGALAVRVERRNAVSRWNEQISLLTNIEGARLLARRAGAFPHVQPVYRVHEPPEPEALERLRQLFPRVAALHGLPDLLGRWSLDESLADYLDRLRGASVPAAVLAALERQALLSGRRSLFTSEPGRHYALGVSPYARFSAPMREVVGIFTHKEALEKLGMAPSPPPSGEDLELRERVIQAANAGKQLQRRLEKRVLGAVIDQLLAADLELPDGQRPLRPAVILGVRPTRLYVRLVDPPLELKVYGDAIESALGPYRVDDEVALLPEGRDATELRFGLGDVITLRTEGRDARGHWRLKPTPV